MTTPLEEHALVKKESECVHVIVEDACLIKLKDIHSDQLEIHNRDDGTCEIEILDKNLACQGGGHSGKSN